MTDTDLRARLDAAITAAREQSLACNWGHERGVNDGTPAARRCDGCRALDRYGDLRELRARWEVIDRRGCERRTKTGTCIAKGHQSLCPMCRWGAEIEADVRQLLGMPVDGSTEAHSARKQDQPSG